MNVSPILLFFNFFFSGFKILIPLILVGGQKKIMRGEGEAEGINSANMSKINEYLPTQINFIVFSQKDPLFRGSGGHTSIHDIYFFIQKMKVLDLRMSKVTKS